MVYHMLSLHLQRQRPTLPQQLAAHFREAIAGGEYAPGEPLPKMIEAAETAGVAVGTVSSAYALLRAEGLVVTDTRRNRVVVRGDPSALFSAT